MNALKAWFASLPRAGRWSVLALVGLVAYFGIAEPLIDRWNVWSLKADSTEAELRKWVEDASARKQAAERVELGVRTFGTVNSPTTLAQASQALLDRIGKVAKARNVSEFEVAERGLDLQRGPLSATLPRGMKVRKIIRQVSFVASPDTVAGVLSDLEKSPEVSSVSRVFVQNAQATGGARSSSTTTGRVVRATLSVETWALVSDDRRAEGGAS